MTITPVTPAAIAWNPPPTPNVHGIVKWWSDTKGYGFLKPDTNFELPDIFAHFSGLEKPWDPFHGPVSNTRVVFDVIRGAKGAQAAHIRPETAIPGTPVTFIRFASAALALSVAEN